MLRVDNSIAESGSHQILNKKVMMTVLVKIEEANYNDEIEFINNLHEFKYLNSF